MKHRILLAAILLLTLAIGLVYSCGPKKDPAGSRAAVDGKIHKEAFVGDVTCRNCHSKETDDWSGSHHDYAMKVADSTTVRADFDNATFKQEDGTYRFFKEDGHYMVEAPGPQGELRIYEITHTFGWEPLQQYLVNFGKGKLQALNVAWDTERERWFSMQPDAIVKPGDWLHWTGGAMNWNTMCADCHSTQLQQNYNPRADSFKTTWTSINVSCEACHGPGKAHTEFMQSEQSQDASLERIREDLQLTKNSSQTKQINTCARCHSLREKLVDGYDHEKGFMDHLNPNLPHPDMYFADGQIREEVYVYGSFLQSKMYKEGIKCNDCHDPHSLQLKANVTDNSLCMQCHASSYNSIEHTFHEPNTEASQCISCHMTGRYYMEVDFRRDHSFRVPRPDLSVQYDVPNACNNCHDDRTAEWAAGTIEDWYGKKRSSHFSETLLKADSLGPEVVPELMALVSDTSVNDIIRATAIWYIGQDPSGQHIDLLKKYSEDDSPLVRKSAVRSLGSLPADQKKDILANVLDDSTRAVRTAAAEGLAAFSVADFIPEVKPAFNNAIKEYRDYLDVNRYFPSGLMNRGQFFEKRGETGKAIQAYKQALEMDTDFNPARLNLAHLYNAQGENAKAQNLLEQVIVQEPEYGPAYYSLALLLGEQGRLSAAVPNFKKAAELMPAHARVHYNLAIVYQRLNQPEAAERSYLQAIDIDPDNPDFLYGISTLYMQQGEFKKALPHARNLNKLQRDHSRYKKLLQLIKSKLK